MDGDGDDDDLWHPCKKTRASTTERTPDPGSDPPDPPDPGSDPEPDAAPPRRTCGRLRCKEKNPTHPTHDPTFCKEHYDNRCVGTDKEGILCIRCPENGSTPKLCKPCKLEWRPDLRPRCKDCGNLLPQYGHRPGDPCEPCKKKPLCSYGDCPKPVGYEGGRCRKHERELHERQHRQSDMRKKNLPTILEIQGGFCRDPFKLCTHRDDYGRLPLGNVGQDDLDHRVLYTIKEYNPITNEQLDPDRLLNLQALCKNCHGFKTNAERGATTVEEQKEKIDAAVRAEHARRAERAERADPSMKAAVDAAKKAHEAAYEAAEAEAAADAADAAAAASDGEA